MAGVLTLEETAGRLGVNVETLRRHRHGDEIRFGGRILRIIRIGRIIKVPVAELERLLGEREAS